MKHLSYRADVDGLRAVAVTLVILYHAELGFSGGYIGVDIFFVISGFLITGMITKSLTANDFRLSQFWSRRIRRIIPASLTMAIVVLFLGVFLLLPDDLETLAESSVAQQLMLSNVFFWQNTGYFDGPAEIKPLLHTWSLAVEEQFYLGYPLLLMLLNRLGRGGTFLALALITVLSLALSEYTVRQSPSATFYLLPTRAWELLLGGLICFAPIPRLIPRLCRESASWCAIALVLFCAVFYDSSTVFPGLSAALPCLAAAVMIYANSRSLSIPGRVLATKPFVFVGLISYSLYLWHWPTLAFLRYWFGNHLSLGITLFALSLALLMAVVSWRFIEIPFRRKNESERFAIPFRWAIGGSGICIFLASTVIFSEGFPARLPPELLARIEEADGPHVEQRSANTIEARGLPILGLNEEEEDTKANIVVWGDSHAEMLADFLRDASVAYDLNIAIAVQHGTVPLISLTDGSPSSRRAKWNDAVFDYIVRNDVQDVVLVSRWENARGWFRRDDRRTLSFRQRQASEESFTSLMAGLEATCRALNEHNVRVWIVKQVPTQIGLDPNRRLFLAALLDEPPPSGISRDAHLKRVSFVERAFSLGMPRNVSIVDPGRTCFREDGTSRISDDQLNSYYRDDDHLSPLGVQELLGELLLPVFKQISDEVHANVGQANISPN